MCSVNYAKNLWLVFYEQCKKMIFWVRAFFHTAHGSSGKITRFCKCTVYYGTAFLKERVFGRKIWLLLDARVTGIVTDATLKGLSHEIDFKNFDQNLKNLA
jgi:hypothetical protein